MRHAPLKALSYHLCRRLIRWVARPRLTGTLPASLPAATVYVLPVRSLWDLIVLDLVCTDQDWPNPLDGFETSGQVERRRFAFLARPAGLLRRHTMRSYSRRLMRLTALPSTAETEVQFLPVQVCWGQAAHRQRSLISNLISDNWAVTSSLRRLIILLLSRHHIVVHVGEPLALLSADSGDDHRRFRRSARLLRARLHGLRVATLGPDLSHRRTLVDHVVRSDAVNAAIDEALAQSNAPPSTVQAKNWRQRIRAIVAAKRQIDEAKARKRLQAKVHKAALDIASDMSYPTILVLGRVLNAFCKRVYDQMRLNGLERIANLAQTHTLIYVPSHRSHMDYLLLSLLLFNHGLSIPHIAAGDNLNLPIIGGLLRRCGAFFMQRSFREDSAYASVFSEYLHEIYRRGHAVEFFIEGGRSRSGRLMPARLGLLNMTLAHARRGLPRPIAFVPVYLGYENLIEGAAYVDELRGRRKRRESLTDIVRGMKLIRRRQGQVDVNIGAPLLLDRWRERQPDDDPSGALALGRELLQRINQAASINPFNLVAMTLLGAPRLVMQAELLQEQIDCCLKLLRMDSTHHDLRVTELNGRQVTDYLMSFGALVREQEEFGETLATDPSTAILLTWHRNNTAHVLALPSLIAFLVERRRRGISSERLERMAMTVFPYAASELHTQFEPGDISRWLGHLVECGLLIHADGRFWPPPASSPMQHKLHLLASIMRQTMERQYIVLSLLTRPGTEAPTRTQLAERSQRIAHKMARLYGINAPEFFDRRLFDGFVNQLVSDGVVTEGADGKLSYGDLIAEVMRASNSVIEDEFRYAVMRE